MPPREKHCQVPKKVVHCHFNLDISTWAKYIHVHSKQRRRLGSSSCEDILFCDVLLLFVPDKCSLVLFVWHFGVIDFCDFAALPAPVGQNFVAFAVGCLTYCWFVGFRTHFLRNVAVPGLSPLMDLDARRGPGGVDALNGAINQLI